MSELNNGDFMAWRQAGKHLPCFMRDFHEQKDLFKSMMMYFDDAERCPVNWLDGHVFAIDWFLWFMAAHGYTLQKSRKKVEFQSIDKTIERCMREWKSQPVIPLPANGIDNE